jgi:uncharacterized phiE125 gp8 family phage protein
MRTVVKTPGAPAITIDEVRSQCRIDDDAEDAYIKLILIPAAESLFQEATRCAPARAVFEQAFDAWPRCGVVRLSVGPVEAVTSVTYASESGAVLPLTGWRLRHVDEQASDLVLSSMPALGGDVRVTYSAGFVQCPPAARLWMLAQVAHLHANREATTSGHMQPLVHIDHLISKWLRQSI